MIPARKQAQFASLFASHARSRITGSFDRFWVRGLAEAKEIVRAGPVLVVSNHTSWWDPLFALHVSTHLLGSDGYALMDAVNLRRLPFFALVGAFGVDLTDARDGVSALRYASRLLDREGRLVWIFPQGRERPTSERPLGFHGGAAAVARLARRATTVPLGIRYELAGTERPHAYLSFGEPVPSFDRPDLACAAQARSVEAELDRIETAVRGDVAGFEDLFAGRRPEGDDAATLALAKLTGLALARGGPLDRR